MKIPVPEEVSDALRDSQRLMHEMNARLAVMERLLVQIRDALTQAPVEIPEQAMA